MRPNLPSLRFVIEFLRFCRGTTHHANKHVGPIGGTLGGHLIDFPIKHLVAQGKDKNVISVECMELWPLPSFGLSLISRPMLGCLDQVAPSNKNRSKQSKSTQIRVSMEVSASQKCVGFCRGNLGFTRWVRCDWTNCSRAGI